MRRILSVALLALGGTFAMSGVASADVDDIRNLEPDGSLFGDAESVDVTGTIRCAATIEYGLWVGVAQEGTSGPEDAFEFSGGTPGDSDNTAEAVGAFGPNFAPPTGISDDSPCSQSLQSFDVLVQQSRDSGDFVNGQLTVLVIAGTSAENGDRGPGPFIGDLGHAEDENATFERVR